MVAAAEYGVGPGAGTTGEAQARPEQAAVGAGFSTDRWWSRSVQVHFDIISACTAACSEQSASCDPACSTQGATALTCACRALERVDALVDRRRADLLRASRRVIVCLRRSFTRPLPPPASRRSFEADLRPGDLRWSRSACRPIAASCAGRTCTASIRLIRSECSKRQRAPRRCSGFGIMYGSTSRCWIRLSAAASRASHGQLLRVPPESRFGVAELYARAIAHACTSAARAATDRRHLRVDHLLALTLRCKTQRR